MLEQENDLNSLRQEAKELKSRNVTLKKQLKSAKLERDQEKNDREVRAVQYTQEMEDARAEITSSFAKKEIRYKKIISDCRKEIEQNGAEL